MMGDCLVLTWPPLGIDRMIMRVTSAVQGRTDDWRVRLDCVQDVYGLPDALFSEAETGWKPPDYTPKALSLYRSYELPYHLVALFVTGDNASSWSDQPEGFGYAAAVAAKPSGLTAGFKVSADGEIVRSLDFTDHALLAEAVDDVAQSMTVSGGSVEGISAGEPFLLDDEWMTVYSYDSSTGALMAGRGCLDTVPAPHAAGAVAWFPGTYNNAVRKTYVHGQNAQISLIPFSVNGAQASSAYAPVAMSNRASRPVAPANVRVNGVYRPKSLAPWATVLDWSRRDRKYTGGLVPNGAGDYVPEAGTEARAAVEERLFPGSAWTPGSTSAGLTGTSLPLAGLYTACAYALRFSLSSRLGPLDSLQTNVVETVHSPWIPEALSMTLTAPPASPSRGDWYIVPSGASGAWAGQAGRLAAYTTSWQFHSPAAGQRADVAGDVREWDGSQWQEV